MLQMYVLRDGHTRYALFVVIAILLVHSYASNVSVTTVALQDQYGLTFGINSAFTAIDQGFSNTTLTQTASTQPCLWTNGTSCNTALTLAHLAFSLALYLETPPSMPTNYTITVSWSQNGGPSLQMGQLTVPVSALALAGEQMTFEYDTGGSSITSPMSIHVAVA